MAPARLVVCSFYLMGPHFQAWSFNEPYMVQALRLQPLPGLGFSNAHYAVFPVTR